MKENKTQQSYSLCTCTCVYKSLQTALVAVSTVGWSGRERRTLVLPVIVWDNNTYTFLYSLDFKNFKYMTVKRLNSAAAAVSLQLCSNLCNPKNCRLPGSPVHGTLQAGILEWAATPSPGDLPDPGIEPRSLCVSRTGGGFLTRAPPVSPHKFLCWSPVPPYLRKRLYWKQRL